MKWTEHLIVDSQSIQWHPNHSFNSDAHSGLLLAVSEFSYSSPTAGLEQVASSGIAFPAKVKIEVIEACAAFC